MLATLAGSGGMVRLTGSARSITPAGEYNAAWRARSRALPRCGVPREEASPCAAGADVGHVSRGRSMRQARVHARLDPAVHGLTADLLLPDESQRTDRRARGLRLTRCSRRSSHYGSWRRWASVRQILYGLYRLAHRSLEKLLRNAPEARIETPRRSSIRQSSPTVPSAWPCPEPDRAEIVRRRAPPGRREVDDTAVAGVKPGPKRLRWAAAQLGERLTGSQGRRSRIPFRLRHLKYRAPGTLVSRVSRTAGTPGVHPTGAGTPRTPARQEVSP